MKDLMSFKVPAIAEAIRDLGYKGKAVINEEKMFIESGASGHNFLIYCFPTVEETQFTPDTEIQYLRFRAWWINIEDYVESEIDALCNWYNLNQPFTKLFRQVSNEKSYLNLEADLYVLDGMSSGAFQFLYSKFVSHLEFADKQLQICKRNSKHEIIAQHDRAIQILQDPSADSEEAVNLYRKNSHLGFAGSQNNFGDLFERGEIVPSDNLLAVYWYTRSSERGEPTAYFSLASVLEKSRNNIDALTVATKYAILASEKLPEGKNKSSAIQIRDTLKEILDPEIFEFAEDLAKHFKPIYEEKWTLSDSPGPSVNVMPAPKSVN